MVVTSDPQVAERIRMLRHHGQREKYHHALLGYNHRLDTLQAAVLRIKLRYLDAWNTARRQHATLYTQLLAGTVVGTPVARDHAEPVSHLYVIRVVDRDALKAHLTQQGIAVGMHYPIPIHLQPAYHDLGYERGSFPVSEACAEEGLSLPMYAELATSSIEYVAQAIRDFRRGDCPAPSKP